MIRRRIFTVPRWRHHVGPALLVIFCGVMYALILLYWAELQGGLPQ